MHALISTDKFTGEKVKPGIGPLFLIQKIVAKEPEKKKNSSTAANVTIYSARVERVSEI